MKTKLNLTIEKNLVKYSKEHARSKGISVSRLIENLLNENVKKNSLSFTEKWQGKFKISSGKDARYKKLEDRYFT